MSLLRPTPAKRMLFFLFFDTILSFLTLYLAFLLRFNFEIPQEFYAGFWYGFFVLLPIKTFFIFYFRVYFVAWRFFSLADAINLAKAHIISYSLFSIVFLTLFQELFYPRSTIIIDFCLSFLALSVFRIAKRVTVENQAESPNNTIIIGANNRASQIIRSFLNQDLDYYPIAIIDEDPNMVGTYFSNIKVHAFDELETITKKHAIQSAMIANDYEPEELDELFEKLKKAGVETIKLIRLLEDSKELKDITIEDLLARKPKDLDRAAIADFIQNEIVMITGAGGSIGSEIARQCAQFQCKKIILVDHSEFNLYQINDQLGGCCELVAKLISITNREKLAAIIEEHRPSVILHAAAFKHVPLCEENIEAAIENNILGSRHVIDLGIAYQVKKIVIISTDKAVRPTNVMGATKRVVELYAQNVNSKESEIVSVRFGNVLGSSGSVIPKFKQQIEQGGPITITHPEIQRYFMLISEACQLVLQAAAIAKGGELFILDMGEPVKIMDMAKKMIALSGKEGEIAIETIGLRPGEKLFEELLIDDSEEKTRYESIHVAKATSFPIEKLEEEIVLLFKDPDKIRALQRIVPEFTHQSQHPQATSPKTDSDVPPAGNQTA